MNGVLHVRPIIGKAGAEKLRAASGLSLLESRVVFQTREFWGGQKARSAPESRELGQAWCIWSCALEIRMAKGTTRLRALLQILDFSNSFRGTSAGIVECMEPAR
jgi:hypothetical protein